jgi:uncharacterized membrane protein
MNFVRPRRVAGVSRMVFAGVMIGLGVLSLINRDFAPIWQASLKNIPARELLVYLCAFIFLLSGIGLLWQRTAAIAARGLLVYLLLWLVLLRVVHIFVAPTTQDSWSGFGETAVIVAGAWVLYAWSANNWDNQRVGFAVGENGLRIARTLYGVALIIFGIAHFNYLKETATLVPAWLHWPIGWAFFFGCTFIVAGAAIIVGVWGLLAAALSALQLGIFTLLVWVPAIAKHPNAFQWSEFVISVAVTAGAWVVADSYREDKR